ncbi:hypothetical protein AB6A40_009746 [Gnathostoma spinigerum]|uniref:Uncharacterized protein n=1 Tax=Gnathostoma spinigerum TaxID=75299 RepID=A0ABD6EVA7_9BILA
MSSCDDFSDDDSDDNVREARSYTAYRNQCGDSMNSSQLLHSRGQISARNRLDYSEDIQPIVDSIDLTDEDVRFAFGSNTTNHAKSKSPVDSSVSLYRTGLRSRNEASRISNRPSHSFYSTFLSDDSSNSSLFEE